LWDATTGAELHRFSDSVGGISSVEYSSDGRFAVTGGLDRKVRVLGLPSLTEWYCFESTGNGIHTVALPRDAQFVLSGGGDSALRLWPLPNLDAPPSD
jgi:WD40 repeat protein